MGSENNRKSNQVSNILITQPKPQSDKSPYFDLGRKHEVSLVFHPFLKLEGVNAKEFRRQKVDITTFSAVIFTSRHAIDHFFRLCEELKVTVSQDTKYFCIAEAVALYLQKFILYRKRKVFFGADGTNKGLLDVIGKHKSNEKFLYVCSENQEDSDIVSGLKAAKCNYALGCMYRTVNDAIKETMESNEFDILCLFTPSAVRSLLEDYPNITTTQMKIAAFGHNTQKLLSEAGLKVEIAAPESNAPNMAAALDIYLGQSSK